MTASANIFLWLATGTMIVINVDEGYVAQYVHVGPEIGVPGKSLQLTTGTIEVDDRMKIEKWSASYSFSVITRHEAGTSIRGDGNYGAVTQTGNGIQKSIGASLNASCYTYVVSYDFDLDNE